MKNTIKIAMILALLVSTAYLNTNGLRADNTHEQRGPGLQEGSGTVVSLNNSSKSGLIKDAATGELREFQYAGPEELEADVYYSFSYFATGSGKIIIRDIHRKTAPTF